MQYIKPESLTWWASVFPLFVGVLIAAEPLHGLSSLVATCRNATGMTAPELINLGLFGIGLRGAIK